MCSLITAWSPYKGGDAYFCCQCSAGRSRYVCQILLASVSQYISALECMFLSASNHITNFWPWQLSMMLSTLPQITVSRSIYNTGPSNRPGRNSSSLAQNPESEYSSGIRSHPTSQSLKQTNLCGIERCHDTALCNLCTHSAV